MISNFYQLTTASNLLQSAGINLGSAATLLTNKQGLPFQELKEEVIEAKKELQEIKMELRKHFQNNDKDDNLFVKEVVGSKLNDFRKPNRQREIDFVEISKNRI